MYPLLPYWFMSFSSFTDKMTFNESLTEDSLCTALNFQSSRIMLLFYTHLCIYLISSAFHKFPTIFFENMEHKVLHLITPFSLRQLCITCCFYHVYLMITKYMNRILLNILTAVSKWCFCVFIDFTRNQWLNHSRA